MRTGKSFLDYFLTAVAVIVFVFDCYSPFPPGVTRRLQEMHTVVNPKSLQTFLTSFLFYKMIEMF